MSLWRLVYKCPGMQTSFLNVRNCLLSSSGLFTGPVEMLAGVFPGPIRRDDGALRKVRAWVPLVQKVESSVLVAVVVASRGEGGGGHRRRMIHLDFLAPMSALICRQLIKAASPPPPRVLVLDSGHRAITIKTARKLQVFQSRSAPSCAKPPAPSPPADARLSIFHHNAARSLTGPCCTLRDRRKLQSQH